MAAELVQLDAPPADVITLSPNRISNLPLRKRFEYLESNDRISAVEVARALGWHRPGHPEHCDTTRVKRTLGITGERRRGGVAKRQYITYELAVRLARALGMDPYEAGV